MKAEIVSIGTELLLGSIVDTNASYLAQRLASLGIDCYYVSQVGDNEARIVETLGRALQRSDLTVTTGGLGPTGDDLTREAIASALGEAPYVVPELEEQLRAFFARRGVSMPSSNTKQATLIPSARILSNPVGTAPGWLAHSGTNAGEPRYIVAMPGVPFEMKLMWEQEVEPWLRPLSPTVLVSRTLKILGLGESAIGEKVVDLMAGSNPTLAPYAKQDGVHLRITAKANTAEWAYNAIVPVERELKERFGEAIYGVDDDTPSSVVAQLMQECDLRISVLEVGIGAIGAVSAPLSSFFVWAGGIGGASRAVAAALLGAGRESDSLEQLSRTLLAKSGADVALGLEVTQEGAASGNSVRAKAEIVLVPCERLEGITLLRAQAEWTTSSGEVPRLVGLTALNSIRRWLLARPTRARQLHEV